MSAASAAPFLAVLFTDMWAAIGTQPVLDDVDRFHLRRCCRTLYRDAVLRRYLFPATAAMETGEDSRTIRPRWIHWLAARHGRAALFCDLLARRAQCPVLDDYAALVDAAMHSANLDMVCALTPAMNADANIHQNNHVRVKYICATPTTWNVPMTFLTYDSEEDRWYHRGPSDPGFMRLTWIQFVGTIFCATAYSARTPCVAGAIDAQAAVRRVYDAVNTGQCTVDPPWSKC
jgi:hypothetical protein